MTRGKGRHHRPPTTVLREAHLRAQSRNKEAPPRRRQQRHGASPERRGARPEEPLTTTALAPAGAPRSLRSATASWRAPTGGARAEGVPLPSSRSRDRRRRDPAASRPRPDLVAAPAAATAHAEATARSYPQKSC